MGRKPTARDVARDAGVSLATVDRVLNNRGGVAPDKEQRVVLAARRLKLDRALDFRAARTLRVAVLIQPPSNPFHAALAAAVETENRGPNPFNIRLSVFHTDPGRPAATARLIERIADHHDALMICAAPQPDIIRALERIAAMDKPVLALATDLGNTLPHRYVGPDNARTGRIAGDLMGRLIGRAGGEILVIVGLLSMTGHLQRREGFRNVLAKRHPACRIVAELESGELGDRAGDLVATALKRYPAIRGVYNASAGARPVTDALRRAGRTGDVVFITHELTEDRRRLLRNGAIDAVLDQNPPLVVRRAVETLAARFGRLDPGPDSTVTPVQIHMRETC